MSLVIAEEIENSQENTVSLVETAQTSTTTAKIATVAPKDKIVWYLLTSLPVERLQFDDIQTTINALVFYSIVSWQLLMISYLVKEDKEYAPEVAFSKQEIEILEVLTNKQILTLKVAVLSIAKFVKFIPTKNNLCKE